MTRKDKGSINALEHNSKAWDLQARHNHAYTVQCGPEAVLKAKQGQVELPLCPYGKINTEWPMGISYKGKDICLLGGGGGHQGPLLALAGANVTVVDLSNKQLAQDIRVAKELGVELKTYCTSADNLSALESSSFDLIINPLSNCFFPKLEPVWGECSRILRNKGEIIYSFIGPWMYLFDYQKRSKGVYELKYKSPYSDQLSLSDQEFNSYIGNEIPLEFGHSLTDQIQGLLKKGLVIKELKEVGQNKEGGIDEFIPPYIIIYACKISF